MMIEYTQCANVSTDIMKLYKATGDLWYERDPQLCCQLDGAIQAENHTSPRC